jgi:hypothetical protein
MNNIFTEVKQINQIKSISQENDKRAKIALI